MPRSSCVFGHGVLVIETSHPSQWRRSTAMTSSVPTKPCHWVSVQVFMALGTRFRGMALGLTELMTMLIH